MKSKKKKQLTGTFGRQGFLVYPMATLLEGKKAFCVCACVHMCVYVCVCVLGIVSTEKENPKSEKLLLKKTKHSLDF